MKSTREVALELAMAVLKRELVEPETHGDAAQRWYTDRGLTEWGETRDNA